ncbi:hypothetical protein PZH32_12975, partial [Adlercreutzia equolifaciens]|nr:hypothetical protein [Adlercreutzia equolifaciens]
MRWLVATTVVTAMLQTVVDEGKAIRFSLKGGSLLQHVLGPEIAKRSRIVTFFAITAMRIGGGESLRAGQLPGEGTLHLLGHVGSGKALA